MSAAVVSQVPTTANKSGTVERLTDLIDLPTRIHQHAIGLVAVTFLAIYGRSVCPFINGIKISDLLVNLGAIWVVQIFVREILLRKFAVPPAGRSYPRQGYFIAVGGWFICGVLALALHWARYENFPISSHVKLLVGYWIIGGGLLAQWEYVVLEGQARKRVVRYLDVGQHLEQINRRVMEGYVLFTLAPSVAMALTLARLRFEGLVDRGIVIEITFLGSFCVVLALAVSFRFGRSLRRDATAVIDGTRRIEKGERNVVLDQTRLDELGAVAFGINKMNAELAAKNQSLKTQIAEKDAMTRVSLAMSSLMPVDTILNLIVENSKLVTHAEASSLLLLDKQTRKMRFHVAKGESAGGLAESEMDEGTSIAGHVAATGKALLVADAYADPRFNRSYDKKSGFRTRDLLTVPMTTKGEVVGVIQVVNKSGTKDGFTQFGPDDQRLLEAFAAQAAVSLENARLLESERKMAGDLRKALEAERNLTIEKAKMGAYMPRSVVDEISKNREQKLALGGRTVTATMLFSDIKGFTALSERRDPQETVGFLNVYMTAMCNILESEGGVVDKFMGDGIMSVFTKGTPNEHAAAAVRAGVRMQQKLHEMRLSDAAIRHLQMRIGINTGEVVAGNIGSETRMDYTVIGDNVNVASRIEGACRPDGVLVSDRTWSLVQSGADQFLAEAQPPLHVKNRDKPVLTFLIVTPICAV
ncbi:MAG: adenylate/guanylate cyclase domain-containing protein [Usitatibacteraceae bacterium]